MIKVGDKVKFKPSDKDNHQQTLADKYIGIYTIKRVRPGEDGEPVAHLIELPTVGPFYITRFIKVSGKERRLPEWW